MPELRAVQKDFSKQYLGVVLSLVNVLCTKYFKKVCLFPKLVPGFNLNLFVIQLPSCQMGRSSSLFRGDVVVTITKPKRA